MSQKQSFYFGELLSAKSGVKYIKVKNDITLTLKEGDAIFLEKPEDGIRRMAEKGVITEEQAAEKISRLPDFLHYMIKTPQSK